MKTGDIVVQEEAVVDGSPLEVGLAQLVRDLEASGDEGDVLEVPVSVSERPLRDRNCLLGLVVDSAPHVRNEALHSGLCRCLDQVQVCCNVHADIQREDDGRDGVILEQLGEGVDVGVVGGYNAGTGGLFELGVFLCVLEERYEEG
jgi:hypothetical protein